MSKYTVYLTHTKELTLDLQELKSIFQDEWATALELGYGEERFIIDLVEEYGLDEVEESMEDGPFSRVYGDLSVVNEG